MNKIEKKKILPLYNLHLGGKDKQIISQSIMLYIRWCYGGKSRVGDERLRMPFAGEVCNFK